MTPSDKELIAFFSEVHEVLSGKPTSMVVCTLLNSLLNVAVHTADTPAELTRLTLSLANQLTDPATLRMAWAATHDDGGVVTAH